MQTELNLTALISNHLIQVDWNHVRACSTEQEAMRLCIQMSKVNMTQRDLSLSLGFKSSAALNSILESDKARRVRNMSRTMQIKLQQICGNTAIDQWAEMYAKGQLNCQRTDNIKLAEELERQAKELRAG